MTASYTPEVTEIKDGASANRLILRVNPIVDGEAVPVAPGRSLAQVVVEGIIGSPEGRSIGSPGDIRVRQDVPQIWQKASGLRTRTGWVLMGGGGGLSAIVVEQDGVVVGEQPAINFTGSVTVNDDPVNDRVDVDIGSGLQPSLAENNVYRLLPAGLGVAPLNLGIPSLNNGGVTHPALASTNLLTSTPRTRWTSAVGAGSTAGHRSGYLMFWRGTGGLGGFDVIFRFAQSSFAAGHRAFTGFTAATTVIPAINPSTLTNIVGVGYDLGSSQWALIHSDAAGPATVTPLGASFNVSTSDLLELRLQAAPSGSEITWRLRNLSTGAEVSGTISANIPAATQFLSTNVWVNTGSDGTTAAQADITLIYAEVA